MDTINKYDSLEQLIYEYELRITYVTALKMQNILMILLNSGKLLSYPISDYKLLSTGTQEQLLNYRLIGGGTGIHWPDIDEDLSLRGFLKEELKKITGINNKPVPDPSSYAMAS